MYVGGGFLPPTPLRPGHLAAKVCPQFLYSHSIVKMGAKFGSNRKILPRGGSDPLWVQLLRILNLSELGANFWGAQGKGEAYCTVRPSPLDVQRALFTVKPALLDVQRTLCTLAPRWGCQSLYIYWTHGPEIIHFGNLGSFAQKWLKMAPKSLILATWAAWRRNGSKWLPNRQF